VPIAIERAGTPRGDDWSFLEKCDPERDRIPLTEGQRALALRYLPMARQLAERSCRIWPTEHDELRSAAYRSLVEAARSFNPSRNVGFGTYARHRIRGALRDLQRLLSSDAVRASGRRPLYHKLRVFDERKRLASRVMPGKPAHLPLEAPDAVERWLSRLPKAQAVACRLIYLHGKLPDEVAAEVGCSKSFLFRLHREAVFELIAHYEQKSATK
jgi:RNA polymerase sigma factor (sigma-70 family)